jgi:alkanesulfonate monooxygenase SsuD/methylene tetrahydromethanopterin reductase-like flavin-dependent oxidoreductase (luciferase family)
LRPHAEAIGLDSLWVCDHFLSGPAGMPAEAIHECWTIVAALAASTNTIELGQLVMCVSSWVWGLVGMTRST